MLLIGTDSNYGESIQMLLKNSNKNLLPYNTSEGGGEFECFSVHLSIYNLFPLQYMDGVKTICVLSAYCCKSPKGLNCSHQRRESFENCLMGKLVDYVIAEVWCVKVCVVMSLL